ncbi:CARDB domain-containing protein [Chloroflexota bacterium]
MKRIWSVLGIIALLCAVLAPTAGGASAADTAILTVTKVVSGGTADPDDFEIQILNPANFDEYDSGEPVDVGGGNWEVMFTLDPGDYKIHEDTSNGFPSGEYYTPSFSGDGSSDGLITLEEGETYDVTVTNTPVTAPADLVSLNVQVDGATNAFLWLWDVDASDYALDYNTGIVWPINGTNHFTAVDVNVPSGPDYEIWVSRPGTSFVVKHFVPNADSAWTGVGLPVGVGTDVTRDCNIHFTEGAFITLLKEVINDDLGTAVQSHFTPYIDGYPVVWGQQIQVASGSHTITETGPSCYTASFSAPANSQGEVTVSKGDDVTVTVTNDDVPSCTAHAEDFEVCLDTDLESLSQTFLDGVAYSTGPECCAVSDIDFSGVDTSTPGDYTYYVTCECPDSPCTTDTASGTITVNDSPTANAGGDQSICESTDLLISASASGGTPAYSHKWTGPGATYLDDDELEDPTFNCGTAGSYDLTYTVTDANGCSDSDTITITVNDSPTANAGGDQSICESTDLLINASASGGTPAYSHKWTGPGATYLDDDELEDPTFNCGTAGSYDLTYTVTDANGCSDSDTITITVNDCEASLSIVKSGTLDDTVVAPSGVVNVGDRIDYTFTVTNEGNVILHNVTVVDTVGGVTVSGGPTTLDVGESDTTTFTGYYYVTQDDINAEHFFNTATADSDESEPATGDEDVPLLQSPDISVQKSVDDTSPDPGDTVTYTITYENTGNVALTSVEIVDDPDETYIASISNISDGGTYAGGEITWNIGTLDPGDSGSVSYDATLEGEGTFDDGSTSVDNVAVVTSDQTEPEEDDETVTVTITPPTVRGSRAPESEPTCWFDVDMLGNVTRIYVTCQDGACLSNYEPEDPDDIHFLEFNRGTQVAYERNGRYNGGPPRWIRMRVSDDDFPLPGGTSLVSEIYSFIGYTTTGKEVTQIFFDREVGMQLDYDPDDLPDNATSVGIAVWDPDEEEWIIMPQSQSSGRVAGVGTATADLRHMSTFAVLATTGETVEEPPAPAPTPAPPAGPVPARFSGSGLLVNPSVERLWGPLPLVTVSGGDVTITATVSNLGEEAGTYTAELSLNGEVIGTQDVDLEAGEEKLVQFRIANVASGDYSVELAGMTGYFTSSRTINWWLLGSGIGIALAAVIVLLERERRRRRVA